MSKHPYRSEARRARDRAAGELKSGDDIRLRYATLELRTAIEALAYERVLMYEDELPISELATWQPKRVFETLLKIDPYADQTSSIRMAKESAPGVPSEPLQELGTERVISIREIKKYYDKLGSYLHAPTVHQIANDSQTSPEKMRIRCEEIREILDKVLASPIYSVNFKISATIECSECGKPIVSRMPPDQAESQHVNCRDTKCPASYSVMCESGNAVTWEPMQHEVACGNTDCKHLFPVWHREFKAGTYWTCPRCKGKNEFAICVRYSAAETDDTNEDHQCQQPPGRDNTP